MKTEKYIKPETTVIEVEPEGVIAYSLNVNETNTAEDGAVYSKRRNFWEE